jgi:antitoxin component of MazEF toxin-antitoxin module
MNTQSIFQVGNSNAITIPPHLMKELGLKKGQEVIVERLSETESFIVTPKNKHTKSKLTEKEYQKWLANFLEEDADLLDELATR